MNTTAGRGNNPELQRMVTVDGEEYKIVTFGPTKAFTLAARLTKFIGEPLASMAGAVGSEQKAAEMLPLAVKSLCNNLDEDAVLSLIKELLNSVSQRNKMLDFEQHFQGRLGHMIKLVGKVVEVQFADFFSELGGSLAEAMEKVKA